MCWIILTVWLMLWTNWGMGAGQFTLPGESHGEHAVENATLVYSHWPNYFSQSITSGVVIQEMTEVLRMLYKVECSYLVWIFHWPSTFSNQRWLPFDIDPVTLQEPARGHGSSQTTSYCKHNSWFRGYLVQSR